MAQKKCRDKYNNTKLQRAEKQKKEMGIGETCNDQSKQKVTRYSSGCATRTSQETCFFCTVDTDILIMSVALFSQINLSELWLAFGTGKNFKYIPAHDIARTLGPEKAASLLKFHAFTGCDQT